jgi:hypothetical protein
MAEHSLTGPTLTPAAHRILQDRLDVLDAALPAPARQRARIVAEFRDGLYSAAEHHLDGGADPVAAAHAAVAEFGDPDAVAASFRDEITVHRARRIGITLLVSGPFVGLAWLAAVVPPLWPPRPADLIGTHPTYLAVLAIAIPAALLAVAATGPLSRRLSDPVAHATRAATVAVIACVSGDVLLLAALGLAAISIPATLAWPTALLAAATSAARLSIATRAAHRCLTGSRTGITIRF